MKRRNGITLLGVLFVSFVLLVSGLKETLCNATELKLPAATELLNWGNRYSAATIKGLRLNEDSPLEIEFIFELNDDKRLNVSDASRMVNYFMAALTLKDEDLWVNLSPYEESRIMSDTLLQTELGRDMLAQDYILKQVSSSMTHPKGELGKRYWENPNKNDFKKIWISPDVVKIYEQQENEAFIIEASLKVNSEKDYLAFSKNFAANSTNYNDDYGKNYLLDQLRSEVNAGKQFAKLRQIYSSIIMANWFKNKFKNTFYKSYINSNKFCGIELGKTDYKERVFELYVDAFKKGVYKHVKSNNYNNSKTVFSSGGELLDVSTHLEVIKSDSDYDIDKDLSSSVNVSVNYTIKQISSSSIIREEKLLHDADVKVLSYRTEFTDEKFVMAHIDKDSGIDMNLQIADELKERMYPVDRLTNYVQYIDDAGKVVADKDKLHDELLVNVDEFYTRLEGSENVVLNSSYENLFYNKPVVVYTNGQLLHAIGENLELQLYPMFVRFKDARKKFIKNVRFKKVQGRWNVYDGLKNLTDEIDFAFFTQLILKDDVIVDPGENIFYYDDIKHLYLMPLITKDDLPQMQEGLMSGGVFWGTSQLLEDDALLAAKAYSAPVALDRNIILTKENGEQEIIDISEKFLRTKLNRYNYREVKEGTMQQGDYKFLDNGKIEIYLKNSPYPFHAIGIKADGSILDVCFEGLSSRRGYTIKQVMAIMKELGAVDAGILDQGNSVRLSAGDKHMSLSPKYKSGVAINSSGTLFYVKSKNSSKLNNADIGGLDLNVKSSVEPYKGNFENSLYDSGFLLGYKPTQKGKIRKFDVNKLNN